MIFAATIQAKAFAVEGAASPSAPVVDEKQEGGSEYEIDYEEESDAEADAPPEAEEQPRKNKKPSTPVKVGSGPAVQGSRAKNRFVPILKSDTRSVYQQGGKSYDVDTD
jgi:hypothetical protein